MVSVEEILENPGIVRKFLVRSVTALVLLIGLLLGVKYYKHRQELEAQERERALDSMRLKEQDAVTQQRWNEDLQSIRQPLPRLLTRDVETSLLLPPLMTPVAIPEALEHMRTKPFTEAYQSVATSMHPIRPSQSERMFSQPVAGRIQSDLPAIIPSPYPEPSGPRAPKWISTITHKRTVPIPSVP